MTTTITLNKTGVTPLQVPVDVSAIALKSITLYKTMYNVVTATSYTTAKGDNVAIAPGYYTYTQLQELLKGEFEIDEYSLKAGFVETVPAELARLISNDIIHLSPLCLYLYVDGLDTGCNLRYGERSNLLSVIHLNNSEVGQIIAYSPQSIHFKKMYDNHAHAISIDIRDEWDNPFTGKFEVELITK